MIYLPTTYDPENPFIVIPRSALVDNDLAPAGVDIFLYGPQGDRVITSWRGAEIYGPYIVLRLDRYDDIPSGEYAFILQYDKNGDEIERGVARVGAIPAGSTQYETNYNVKEYE